MVDRNVKKNIFKNTVIKFPVSFLLPQWLHYKYWLLAELGHSRGSRRQSEGRVLKINMWVQSDRQEPQARG